MRSEPTDVLHVLDPDYPTLLRDLARPPEPLYIEGRLLPQDAAAVAIVGSRNPTPYGRFIAGKLAGELSGMGITIVSGMARGIDAAAHRSCLDGGGRTIAVLGCGLDVDYPKGNRWIRERIPRQGALLSEFPAGTPPLPSHFPRRNRLISGIALGVVVVEAGQQCRHVLSAQPGIPQCSRIL